MPKKWFLDGLIIDWSWLTEQHEAPYAKSLSSAIDFLESQTYSNDSLEELFLKCCRIQAEENVEISQWDNPKYSRWNRVSWGNHLQKHS